MQYKLFFLPFHTPLKPNTDFLKLLPHNFFIADSVITFTQDSVRLETAPTDGCADIFGFYYKLKV